MRYVILRDGLEVPVEVSERPGGYRVVLDGTGHDVDSLEVVPGLFSLLVGGLSYEVTVHRMAADRYGVHLHDGFREVDLVHPMTLLLQKMGGAGSGKTGAVTAPMPGKVVRVLVKPGDRVAKGSGIVVLEAMKMQNELQAPGDGVVTEVRTAEGESVEGGQVLAVVEPEAVG